MITLRDLTSYAVGQWEVVGQKKLTPTEARSIREATVVTSKYGLSAKILMVAGDCRYVPISRDSILAEGDDIEPSAIVLITLSRDGNEIARLDVE